MGVIKDGAVSGTLPETLAFAVHYPGYPSSTSRAVETLGGSQGILKAHSMQTERLKLRFRPEDPYSHPAFGDLRPCSNLLLRISKKRIAADQDAVASKIMSECSLTEMENLESRICCPADVKDGHENTFSENALDAGSKGIQPQKEEAATVVQLSADIVARVTDAYHFNGMVDYQHVVAVHAHASRNSKRKRDKPEEDPSIDQEDVMILVPPLFSPKDMPEKLVLKPSATVSSKKKQEAIVKQRWEMQIEPCLAIDFNIEEIPRKINWEDNIPRGSDHWQLQMAVSKVFDERPIWSSNSLHHRLLDIGLTVGAHMFKRLLFRTAYYFSTGPFRRFWIRKGYDPRKDPESRVYQTIDFRVPPPLRSIGDISTTDRLKHMWKDICAFRVFPCKSQTSLQLFDLADDFIQEEIRKPPEQTCSSLTGWFSSFVLDSLRLRITVRFLSVYPKVGAESFLKAASVRFEKSKRAKRDFRLKEVEPQNMNKESSSHASKVSPVKSKAPDLVNDDGKYESDDDDNNEGYDDVEEEDEEEEEEEELYDYESYQVDADDGDFTLHPYSYGIVIRKKLPIQFVDPTGENISKNYLQELFGSFPSSTAADANKDQDAEYSDGEYQIFEQDDDNNNYSDEDDS